MHYQFPWKRTCPAVVVLLLASLLAGCSGLSSGGGGTTQPPPSSQTSVSVTPSTASVRIGDNATFTASVTNNSNTAVTWSVNGVNGGNSTTGTITSAGVYTSPSTIPAGTAITVKATSVGDTTASASATITLQNPIPVVITVSPSTVSVGAFTLTVTGTKFVTGAQVMFGGQALTTTFVSATQLTATGTATAAQAGPVNVTVVNPNPGTIASANYPVTVSTTATVVAVSPATANVRIGSSTTFTATVTNNTTTTVTWAVNGVNNGNSTVGTINSSGTYTPPATIPTTAITITATSTAVPTASATANVTVQNPIPIVGNVNPTTIPVGAFTLTITGSRFITGAQVMFGSQALPTTFVSANQLTATGNAATAGSVNVTVVNPDPGTVASANYAVTVSNSAPQVTYNAAVRFLEQSTFGPTPSLIAHVQQVGFDAFLTEQFAAPVSTVPFDPNFASNTTVQNQFYFNALTGQNQLRQRVAFALQQIIVVSGVKITHDDSTNANMNGLVAWQQMMEQDAFSNYSTLLKDVTLSPVMGNYLDMVNNDKPATGKNPNENYAREVLQLFSIGLYELNPDGSQKLDGSGQPINTYDQDVVEGYAHLFTGWTYPLLPGKTQAKHNPLNYGNGPMVVVETNHDNVSTKEILGGVTLPAGQTSSQDLDAGLAAIANHANVGPFIGKQLIQRLVKSNPSPAYVSRISSVWANNGSGVRGDLQAVVRAILLDPEARAGDDDSAPTADAGHLREPALYVTAMLRALNVASDATRINGYTTNMGQNILFSPSVFNYFPPDYEVSAGVLGPEFNLLGPATAIIRANFVADLTLSSITGTTVDFTPWTTLAADPNKMLDSMNALFLHGQMSQAMHDSILTAVNAVPATNPSQRAKQALYLVLTSPQYQVEQ